MPINELARICFASLIIMTGLSFIITRLELIEKIRKHKITNISFTIFNFCLSVASIYFISQKVFVGLLFVYLCALMWFIQYSKNHSLWLRPISMTAGMFLFAILALWWFDSLPLLKKIWFVLKNA